MSVSKTHAGVKAQRHKATAPEAALWEWLSIRQPGYPAFRRRHSLGAYTFDFYSPAARLAVEIDDAPDFDAEAPPRDKVRTTYLGAQGVRLLRYSAAEVRDDPDLIMRKIMRAAVAGPPSTAHSGGAKGE